jgi:hypothetical protein
VTGRSSVDSFRLSLKSGIARHLERPILKILLKDAERPESSRVESRHSAVSGRRVGIKCPRASDVSICT